MEDTDNGVKHWPASAVLDGPSDDIEEEFTCGVCFELLVQPTTLNCGHSFCRHCLAHWFDRGQKAECPLCREKFTGLPMENVQIKSSLVKLFGSKYEIRKAEVLSDKENTDVMGRFEASLQKQHDNEELSATSYGCLIGSSLAVVVISCLYLASHWGSSESNMLVKKPLMKWSVNDVSDWLDDLGLSTYKTRFSDENVNGRMLAEVKAPDLVSMFAMDNPLHQRVFLQALNHTKTQGAKLPTNLWEYKALYSGYTTFLLYSMSTNPRISLLYLYIYERDSYEFYKQTFSDCNGSIDSADSWLFPGLSLIAPHVVRAKFFYCFSDLHYWTSRFIIFQCICKATLDFISLGNSLGTLRTSPVYTLAIEFVVTAVYYYGISCIWWMVPIIARDALFYAELYFSPFYFLREVYRKLRPS